MSEEKKPDNQNNNNSENSNLKQALYGKAPVPVKKEKSEAHKFWDTQPVPKFLEKHEKENGPIDPEKTPNDIRKEPLLLPKAYTWSEIDIDKEIQSVYDLLNENYVEDDDNMFRFDYSKEFLLWALKPPGFKQKWHLGVKVANTGKLMGFITAIPAKISVYGKQVPMVEINFLCVHKKLRDNRLAPVLIREITRRVNEENIWQAVYTAGRILPRPVSVSRYWHRSLNPKKLVNVGFSHKPPKMTMKGLEKLFKLPEQTASPMVPLAKKHVKSATKLLNEYLSQFDLKTIYDEDEFEHWFSPQDRIVFTYVLEDKEGNVTDLCSFYELPSTIIGNKNYSTLRAAYSYYNIAKTVPLVSLMKDALIFAKNNSFDVFNCLDIMENEKFLKELNFGKGDGNLQYYLYNWKCPEMPHEKLGLVLL